IHGELVAPPLPSAWAKHDPSQWLAFKEVSGLRVYGNGRINGQGFGWWNQSCKYHPGMVTHTHKKRRMHQIGTNCEYLPHISGKWQKRILAKKSVSHKCFEQALKFLKCNETSLTGIHFINSSQTHVTLFGCDEFRIDSLVIEAPGNSPNTDGIHLQYAHNVVITNTMIGTGAINVFLRESLQFYASNYSELLAQEVKIFLNVMIAFQLEIIHPTLISRTSLVDRGMAIGSLGKGGSYVQVQNIHVKDVYFKGTSNGARIKTWQEGRGFVRRVIYENIFFNSVRNPLVIDQNYGSAKNGTVEAKMGVHISDVTYRNFYGNSASNVGITLNCSESVACTGLRLDSIMLWPNYQLKEVTSYCFNAYGVSMGVIQPPPCLKHISIG
ncbi:hypothetical protein KSS87_015839, partial [Heliosperma pusillum]